MNPYTNFLSGNGRGIIYWLLIMSHDYESLVAVQHTTCTLENCSAHFVVHTWYALLLLWLIAYEKRRNCQNLQRCND